MTRLEHLNITVPNMDEAINFIRLVAPDFSVRKDAISELGYRWVHIGNDECYLALQESHPGFSAQAPHTTYRNFGVNHIGLIIDNAQATETLLLENGYKPNGPIVAESFRKRIYFFDHAGFEWEMVEYASVNPKERYLYE